MLQKIVVYSEIKSPRLQYILDYVFHQRLHLDYYLTDNISDVNPSQCHCINYSKQNLNGIEIQIKPSNILFENNIVFQQLRINRWKHTHILFYNNPAGKIPFDLFGAIFYILSRYEEYFKVEKDAHNRFAAKDSCAFQYSFLNQPVVDLWLHHFKQIITQKFGIAFQNQHHTALFTYDVDMVWKYKYKPYSRQLVGAIKDLILFKWPQIQERYLVLKSEKPDPFYCFDRLSLDKALVFVLLSEKTRWDRNTHYSNTELQKVLKTLSTKAEIGIHPSYYSNENQLIKKEKKRLEEIIEKPVLKSRQHFIKLHIPETYRQLIDAGITADYSMGYPEVFGFRAGTSLPFYWYDLEKNTTTPLQIHPFCLMDATAAFYSQKNIQELMVEMTLMHKDIKLTGGCFTGIWHNYLIGDTLNYPKIAKFYTETLKYLEPEKTENQLQQNTWHIL